MGGDKRKSEKARLRKGVCILAATPGRLIDHLKNSEAFKVTSLEYLVLDEADRLLDLGFEPQVTEILELLKEKLCRIKRQNILISATLDKNIRSLADKTLKDPVVIDADETLANVTSEEKKKKFTTPQQLAQHFVEVPLKQRFLALYGFLRDQVVVKGRKVMVFLSCCDSVEYHHTLLRMLLLKEDKEINGYDALLKSADEDSFPIVRLLCVYVCV